MQIAEQILTQQIQWTASTGAILRATVARLDLLHPVVSGNKFFKLKYNLEQAVKQNKGIITMGGAYSNHLAATAYACAINQIPSIGVVRGEIAEPLSYFCFLYFAKDAACFCKQVGLSKKFS